MATEYEITYLTDPQLTQEQRGELDASIDEQVGEVAGQIIKTTPTLKRRLMYPIDKKMAGFSRTLQIALESDKIEPLKNSLTKKAGVMRVLVLATSARPEVASDVFTQAALAAAERASGKVKKPDKPVTMEAVEKGIEEALKEEVK